MSAGGFEDILHVFVFLMSVWAAGRLLRALGVSPILGQIVVGMALGPEGLNFVPFAEAFETLGTFGGV